jgi:GxxExxY protein
MSKLILEQESYKIIGICQEVHRILGPGFLEIVYKDAIEFEFRKNGIDFFREIPFEVNYKGERLKHKFYADFVVFDSIILELKSASSLNDLMYAQTLNYLKVSKLKIGLLINFGEL